MKRPTVHFLLRLLAFGGAAFVFSSLGALTVLLVQSHEEPGARPKRPVATFEELAAEFEESLLRQAELDALNRQADALEAMEWQNVTRRSTSERPESPLADFMAERHLRQEQREAELYRTNMMNTMTSIEADLDQVRWQQQQEQLREAFQR